jgi:hypothetical protein
VRCETCVVLLSACVRLFVIICVSSYCAFTCIVMQSALWTMAANQCLAMESRFLQRVNNFYAVCVCVCVCVGVHSLILCNICTNSLTTVVVLLFLLLLFLLLLFGCHVALQVAVLCFLNLLLRVCDVAFTTTILFTCCAFMHRHCALYR